MIIRITQEETGDYVEGKLSDDASYDVVVDILDGLMVAYGFHPNTVKEYRNEEN